VLGFEARSRSQLWAAALCADVLALGWIAITDTGLRFTYAPLNYLVFILLAVGLPVTLVGFAITTRRYWLRWLAIVVSVFVCVPVLMCSCVVGVDLANATSGKDPSFERIGELSGPFWAYRVYRTNGGATTSYGLVLRREHDILPGMAVVSRVHSFYPASEMSLERCIVGEQPAKLARPCFSCWNARSAFILPEQHGNGARCGPAVRGG
jgi:hypothetical protein